MESRHGRIDRLQLHDPATGLTHPLVAYRYVEGDLVAAEDALGVPRTFAYRQHRMVRHTWPQWRGIACDAPRQCAGQAGSLPVSAAQIFLRHSRPAIVLAPGH